MPPLSNSGLLGAPSSSVGSKPHLSESTGGASSGGSLSTDIAIPPEAPNAEAVSSDAVGAQLSADLSGSSTVNTGFLGTKTAPGDPNTAEVTIHPDAGLEGVVEPPNAPQTSPSISLLDSGLQPDVVQEGTATNPLLSQSVVSPQPLTAGVSGVTIDGTPFPPGPSPTALTSDAPTKAPAGSSTEGMTMIAGLGFPLAPDSDVVIVGGTAVIVGSSTIPVGITLGQEANGLVSPPGPGSDLVFGAPTITPGASAVMVSGTAVSLAVDGTAMFVDSSTKSLPVATIQPAVTAGAFTFVRGLGSALVVGTQTIAPGGPGGPAMMISGTPVSLALDGTAIVIDSSTKPLPVAPIQPAVTAGAFTFVRGLGSALVVGTQTITPGAPAMMISGTPVSLALDGTAIVVGSSTETLPAAQSQGVATAGAFTFNRGSGSDLVIGTQTVTAGAPAVTISGTPVSLPVDATAVVIGGSTLPLSRAATMSAVLTINGNNYTAISGSTYLIGSQTLVPGGPAITVSGTPFSLPLSATAVVAVGSTVPIPDQTSAPTVLEINGQTFTRTSGSNFLIGTQTLVPGGAAITVNGTLVSLGAAATNLVLGTQTESLTTSQGLGAIIMGEFSDGGPGGPVATNTSTVVGLTGGASQIMKQRLRGMWVGVILSCVFASVL
ncbi:MAG: hypothetical protein Q9221_003440 [Calogaya cf. arnoldii]